MQFTREQFDQQVKLFYKDQQYALFNLISTELQGKILRFGINDVSVMDDIFAHFCNAWFNMSAKDYYNSYITKEFFYEGNKVSFDFIVKKLSECNDKNKI